MALKIFLFGVIVVSFFLTNIAVVEEIKEESQNNLPKISFSNATLYEIDQFGLTTIVNGKKFFSYEKYDELHNGVVTIHSKDGQIDTINAGIIRKKGKQYEFEKDVLFVRSDGMRLTTQALSYDRENELATNQVPFLFSYNKSSWSGTHLLIDKKNKAVSGENAHFVINEKDI